MSRQPESLVEVKSKVSACVLSGTDAAPGASTLRTRLSLNIRCLVAVSLMFSAS